MPAPDYDTLLSIAWGWPDEAVGLYPGLAAAANITIGQNPPYALSDLLAIYPKFFGPSLSVALALTQNNAVATLTQANPALAAGQLITGAGIPANTMLQSVNGTAVVLTSQATSTLQSSSALVYTAPLTPLAVLNAYIALASASLSQARYQEAWTVAMALYVAHFATLWMQSDGTAVTTASQAAQFAIGKGVGVTTAKAVGDESVSYQPLAGLEDWAAWNLTTYGVQFASMARVIGAGAMVIW